MRNTLYLTLAAAGLAGLAFILCRRGCCRRVNPARESERLIDHCQDALDRIQDAMRGFQTASE